MARRSLLDSLVVLAGVAVCVLSVTGCGAAQSVFATATPAVTQTSIPTATFTPTNTPPPTPTSTRAATPTNTRTLIPTSTQTPTPSNTPTRTPIPTLNAQQEEKVTQLIEQLKSGDQNVVETAHTQLSGMTKQLSQHDVEMLGQIMRAPGVTWAKVVGKSGHCIDYARRTTAWYAAFLLVDLDMDKSPYIDAALSREAFDALGKSESQYRVTVPGWT